MQSRVRDRVSGATLALMTIACMWVIAMSAMSILGNGWIYRIEQPAPATVVGLGLVIVHFERDVLIPFWGECSNYLVCQNSIAHLHQGERWHFKRGDEKYDTKFYTPPHMTGGCHFQGTVRYQPLGWIGPTMHYEWRSEEFVLR